MKQNRCLLITNSMPGTAQALRSYRENDKPAAGIFIRKKRMGAEQSYLVTYKRAGNPRGAGPLSTWPRRRKRKVICMHQMTRHTAGVSWPLLAHLPQGSNGWAASPGQGAKFQNPVQGLSLTKELYLWCFLHGVWLLK